MFIRKRTHPYAVVLLFIALVSLWGCPKSTEVTSTPEAQAPEAQKDAATPQAAQPETAQPGTKAGEGEESSERASAASEGLKPVYFDFDKSFIRDDAKDVMKANAAWLKANPTVKIRIEGNCDERGTKEYNQALGQRRAVSVKRYLTDLGVSGSRISLISYGKEKPVCTESTERCWQKNRKDDFVVKE